MTYRGSGGPLGAGEQRVTPQELQAAIDATQEAEDGAVAAAGEAQASATEADQSATDAQASEDAASGYADDAETSAAEAAASAALCVSAVIQIDGGESMEAFGTYEAQNQAGPITVLLPASPSYGEWVVVQGAESFGVNAVTVDGGSNAIMVSADTECELDIAHDRFYLWWDSSASLWMLVLYDYQGTN